MNLENFSYIIAIILLIASIISPIVTVIINNIHQTKIKKLDMYEEAKRKALSDFINSAQNYLLNSPVSIDEEVKYYSSLNTLFLYFKNININTFKGFEETTKNTDDYLSATIELTKIVQDISKQIKKL